MEVLKTSRGQTSLEYLMLLVLVFVTSYFMVTGPMADFTQRTILDIRSGIQSTVRNAQWKSAEQEPGTPSHPSNRNRFRPIHF